MQRWVSYGWGLSGNIGISLSIICAKWVQFFEVIGHLSEVSELKSLFLKQLVAWDWSVHQSASPEGSVKKTSTSDTLSEFCQVTSWWHSWCIINVVQWSSVVSTLPLCAWIGMLNLLQECGSMNGQLKPQCPDGPHLILIWRDISRWHVAQYKFTMVSCSRMRGLWVLLVYTTLKRKRVTMLYTIFTNKLYKFV